MPDVTRVTHDEIVGREVRLALFEDPRARFSANILNLDCTWSEKYEDRLHFNAYNLEKENHVLVKIPEHYANDPNRSFCLIIELVIFVKRKLSQVAVAMTAGFARLDLAPIDREHSYTLGLTGGSPYKEKNLTISPNDIRTTRQGFIPKISSIFEGKVSPTLYCRARPLKINPSVPTDYGEEIELLPEIGVYHWPQMKIISYYRQCLGRDAFSMYGSVSSSSNPQLGSEVYVNSFCSLFCMPKVAVIVSDFWNKNVMEVFAKERYETRMDILKMLLNYLYTMVTSANFRCNRHYPTSQLYSNDQSSHLERMGLLKAELSRAWEAIQIKHGNNRALHPAKLWEPISKIAGPTQETKYTAFNIEELMDDDFGI